MSWAGQQYGGQGPAPGQPPHGQYGAPAYGAPGGQRPMESAPRYRGQQLQGPGYGSPTQHGYGDSTQQNYGAPQQHGYGTAQSNQSYGSQGQFGGQPGSFGGGSAYHGAPPGVDPELWTWFQSVDTDHSGKITSTELQQALLNGNWSPFNPETCRLMIGMFDRDRNGSIDIHEFAALWRYIQDWKACFDRFDTDRSGNIDSNELSNAFQTFGYKLSPQFSQLVVRVFDRNRGGRSINFDDFIQACVMLKTLTDKFRVKDVSQAGQIAINYEEFLEMALDTTLSK